MEEAFASGLAQLGLSIGQVPNLARSVAFSSELIANGRAQLGDQFAKINPELDVVAFGSLARYEMTEASDLDYLVVVYGFDEKPGVSRAALKAAGELRKTIKKSGEIRAPGATGVFGNMVSAIDLVEVIGLEDDTNRSHTRRILLLEESVSLYNPEKHLHLLTTILSRYLTAKPLGKTKIPRFLLNDLCRYWRTLTVDYQAKTETFPAHSTRYLKLIMSRKFTFASSILPLFTLGIQATDSKFDAESEFLPKLVEIYSKPPIVRYLDAAAELIRINPELAKPLAMSLLTVDKVNGLLGDQDWRDGLEAEALRDDHAELPHFKTGRALAEELQGSLEDVFFSAELRQYSQRYLVF